MGRSARRSGPPVFTLKGFDFFPPCPPGRDGNRQVNVTPFHAGSFLRNPSLPAGIIETGATPTGESGDRHPQCALKRVSSAARGTKKWGRSRHSLPLPTDAEQGWVYGANHKETEMIMDIEMCALIVRMDPRFQCAASTGTGVAH